MEQYRRVREELRGERGRRKQRELCDELDRLWCLLPPADRKSVTEEFMLHEGRRRR